MSARSPKRSVLIVEDDRSLRECYRNVLRSAGYDVGAVENGTDALRRLEHWSPDVIVLDLALPQMNGRDLFRSCAGRDTGRIPVVIVSGMDTSDSNGADFAAILQKPVDANGLIDAVNDAIQPRRDAASS